MSELDLTDLPLVEIGECPYEVVYEDIGAASTRTAPNGGNPGTFTDMTISWYEPPYLAGELLLFVLISSGPSLSAPAGYTTVSDTSWDDAPITPPLHGTNSATDGPAEVASVQQLIAYRITTSAGGSDSVAAGTYTGFKYTDGGLGYGNTAAAVRVYRFQLQLMGGDYDAFNVWPANPVKVSSIAWDGYKIEHGVGGAFGSWDWDGVPGSATDHPGPTVVNVPDITADHPGNHVWMTVVTNHGRVDADATADFPGRTNSMSLQPQQFKTTGTPGLDTFGVINASTSYSPHMTSPGMNAHIAVAYLAQKDYFQPFRPYGYTGTDDPGLENGFTDQTFRPGRQFRGHNALGGWQDGFLGVEGTDFYYWKLCGGIAAQQIIIQGPEATRPPNDDIADAASPPECPVMIAECIFGQTREPGETFGGLGTSANNSVWFTYTPTNNETDVLIATDISSSDPSLGSSPPYFTEYNTILLVYSGTPGALTLIASDDDSGLGTLSTLTVDLTGGTTYYIQVVGRGGDEGRLLLTINCEGVLEPYWGILDSALPAI